MVGVAVLGKGGFALGEEASRRFVVADFPPGYREIEPSEEREP
ncbi:MAG: hypothetical protein WKH64_13905 [Chloroflexia bacterium]